jgi:splicing factor 45
VKPLPTTAVKAASNGEWSAALKFAPRIPKSRPIPTPRPVVSTTTFAAAPVIIQAKAEIVKPAEVYREEVVEQIVLGLDGKPLARAPAMTLIGGKWKGKGKGKGKKVVQRDHGGAGDVQKKKKKKKVGVYLKSMDRSADVIARERLL